MINFISNKKIHMDRDYQTYNLKFVNDSEQVSLYNNNDWFDPQSDLFHHYGNITHFMNEEYSQQQWKEKSKQLIQLKPALLNTEDSPPLPPPPPINHSITDPSQQFLSLSVNPTNNSQIKMKRGPKKGLKVLKPKNQYDKNMFPLITRVILNKMLSEDYLQEISSYCEIHKVQVSDYLSFFYKFDFTVGWGINKFMSFVENKKVSLGIRNVFKYFFVRYLKEDYPVYVMNEGRMREQQKYLKKGLQMLYIPLLNRSDLARLFPKRQIN